MLVYLCDPAEGHKERDLISSHILKERVPRTRTLSDILNVHDCMMVTVITQKTVSVRVACSGVKETIGPQC